MSGTWNNADDAEREVGIDADGLLWVTYTRHSAGARERNMGELQDLLEEAKGLYREKYVLDHVDEIGHEVGIDADGLLWVAATGQGTAARECRCEGSEGLLEDVMCLYSEKYQLDHIDNDGAEVGHDSDGLLWVRYTGSGGRGADRAQQFEALLEEVKCLYSARYPLDYVDDEGRELGCDADGLFWVEQSGLGISDVSELEADEDNKPARSKRKMETLQDMLCEVRRLYN